MYVPCSLPPPSSPVLGELRGRSPKSQPPSLNQFMASLRYFPRISPITLGSGTAHLASLPAWNSCSNWWVPDPLGSPDPPGCPGSLPEAAGSPDVRHRAPREGRRGLRCPPARTHTPGTGWGRRGGPPGVEAVGEGWRRLSLRGRHGGAAAPNSLRFASQLIAAMFYGGIRFFGFFFFWRGDATRGFFFWRVMLPGDRPRRVPLLPLTRGC